MLIEPGDVSVSSTKRKPGWYDAAIRPGPAGRRVSGPPTPARPTDSSEAGAPGALRAVVPAATAGGGAPLRVTLRGAGGVEAGVGRVCALAPGAKGGRVAAPRPGRG